MNTRRLVLPALLAALSLVLAAQTPAAAPAPAKPGAPTAPATPPTPPDPSGLKPFADIIKEAKEAKGFFPVFQKDEKVWIEVSEASYERPFLLTWNTTKGIGERQLYAGMMGGSQLATFRRLGNTLQLIALNPTYQAHGEAHLALSVKDSFSESLLASAPVLSKPHPERKSVLVDASALLFVDLPGTSMALEQLYRQNYSLDRANSSFAKVRATDRQTAFTVNAHFMAPRLAMPNAMTPPAMRPSMPGTVPDPRSFFMGTIYSFLKLPETPMTPRLADDRIGYFVTTQWDFAQDRKQELRKRFVNRWRLEKKDPDAAMSEPKEPITFWVDKGVPERYQKPIVEGILEWNRAFEKIGFKNAVQAKVQPLDADWDNMDARHACIRWLVGTDVAFAIGPSTVDPRTGEILDADIGFGESMVRSSVEQVYEDFPKGLSHLATGGAGLMTAADLQSAAFGMDLLEARGDVDFTTAQGEAVLLDRLKWIVTHEVGHTLGLRHNFKASTVYTDAQLKDRTFTEANGTASSIMEYTPFNIPAEGEKAGQLVSGSLGPWDHWVIEYGYKPFSPEKEAAELTRIAERSADPQLAYGTDEDNMMSLDPTVNTFDIGPDTLAYAQKRIKLSAELCDRVQKRTLKPGEPRHLLRRQVNRALGQLGQAANIAAKYIGGATFNRDHEGTGRANINPIPAAKQREALQLLEKQLFSLEAFRFKPEFLARLTMDRTDIADAFQASPDYSVNQRVLGIQRMALGMLMQPNVAQRILDTAEKVSDPKQAFRLPELYDGLQAAVWTEAKSGKEPSLTRRGLQREHLRALANLVLRAAPGTPEDARSLARENLTTLSLSLKTASAKPGLSKETRAHYAECQSQIQETLKAGLQRTL